MIKNLRNIKDYNSPTFLQDYVDRGIFTCSDISFVDNERINVKRAQNIIRKGNTESPKSKKRITKFEKQFSTVNDDGLNGWDSHYPCAVLQKEYGKDGEQYSTVGYNHKIIASCNIKLNPPAVIIEWSDSLSDAEKLKYYYELLAKEQTDSRVNQDDADDDEIVISLKLAKQQFDAILTEGGNNEFDTAEEYLNDFLKNTWGKSPKQKKWVNQLKKILGNKSSYASITDFSSVNHGTEYIRDDYDGEFNFRTFGKISDKFAFDGNTYDFIENSSQLFKPEFIYSNTLKRRWADLLLDLRESEERGDNYVISVFYAIGGDQNHIKQEDIDNKRKDLIIGAEKFYSYIKDAGLSHRVLQTAFLGQNPLTDEIGKLIDYESEKKRLIN